MAPVTRRASARAAAGAAHADILQLPDDALRQVLGHLELRQRLACAALVCRRFRDLCFAPEFLREVKVVKTGDASARALLTARVLLPWLQRHGAHVQWLQLWLRLPYPTSSDEQRELADRITACVASSGSGGQLEELDLTVNVPLPPLAWLADMRTLQRLSIASWHEMRFAADCSGLPALRDMCVSSPHFEATARLPTALTRLDIEFGEGAMPQQLALLPNLRRLSFRETSYSEASMAAVSRLTALTGLDLCDVSHQPPPASLAALTSLRHVRMLTWPAELPPLQQLTQLALDYGQLNLPPAVGSLPHLQRLMLYRDGYSQPPPPELTSLPQPHSLHSLRYLYVRWRAAAASLPALAAMPALEELWLDDVSDHLTVSDQAWAAFWAWAAQHTPLRCLRLGVFSGPPQNSDRLQEACALLSHSRPLLSVHVGCLDYGDVLFRTFFQVN